MQEDIKLTNEQEQALAMMLSGKNVFLTGKAGTGKSTILHKFKEVCTRECVFLAPTGIAAINIGGSTLHSFFQLKPGLLTPDSMEELRSKKRINLIRQVETIVIDEVSMVRSDLFAAIDARLREVTKDTRPFGGKQIILVGDFFQLPPVVKTEPESAYLQRTLGGYYAFQTKLWNQADFHCMCLQTIHRQQNDVLFLSILNHLRYGELEKRDLLLDGQDEPVNAIEALTRLCVKAPALEQTPVYLCTTNFDADAFNQHCLGKLKSETHTFRAAVFGKFKECDYPTQETLALKIGARVMTLTNKRTPDGEIEYVNGEIGVVEAVEDGDDAVVQVRLDRGATVSVQRAEWSQYEYYLEYDANSCRQVIRQNEVGKFVQMPLKLSYATTIHKAQGLSLDYVSVKLGNGCFAHGQFYTAISRCRTIKNLRIDRPVHPEDSIIDQAVIDFYRAIEGGRQPEHKPEGVTLTIPKEYKAAIMAYLAQLQGGNSAMSLPLMIPRQEPSRRRLSLPTGAPQNRQVYPPFEQQVRLQPPFPEMENSQSYPAIEHSGRLQAPVPELENHQETPFMKPPMLPENGLDPEGDEPEMTEEEEMDAIEEEMDEELQAEIEAEIDEALKDDEEDDEEDEKRITEDPDIDHLLVVYRNQNPDERFAMATKRVNGVGFNKHDAPVLTPLAEKYLVEGYLFESEMETVHHLVPKYWRQWV